MTMLASLGAYLQGYEGKHASVSHQVHFRILNINLLNIYPGRQRGRLPYGWAMTRAGETTVRRMNGAEEVGAPPACGGERRT